MFRSLSDRQKYVDGIRSVVCDQDNLRYMSKLAVGESGMGKFEHKMIKNALAAEKSPGVEDLTTQAMAGDDGLTLVEYCPFGVIGAIAPTTNPTETIICNSIAMLAGGNTVVFSPHPRSKGVSIWLIQKLNAKLEELGAPKNLIVTVREPSIENTNIMMKHPKIRLLAATGGPGIVKAVMSTGKKAIGAGAGNPPVVVIFMRIDYVSFYQLLISIIGKLLFELLYRYPFIFLENSLHMATVIETGFLSNRGIILPRYDEFQLNPLYFSQFYVIHNRHIILTPKDPA